MIWSWFYGSSYDSFQIHKKLGGPSWLNELKLRDQQGCWSVPYPPTGLQLVAAVYLAQSCPSQELGTKIKW